MQLLATRLARPVLSGSIYSSVLSAVPRTFTTLSPLRPALTPLRQQLGASPFAPSSSNFVPTSSSLDVGLPASDLGPSCEISSHPALAGMQLRFAPRNTMNGHTRLVQKRRLGFLSRQRSRTGRKIIMRRRMKGRRVLGCH
ncbi:hypothetical protein HIM_05477 [Hirsutella minnesotensis 3608]|uniref:Ribosomal protein L34 n=1 Tax=Hirsutella minnesotensis 3608 TaxID=1043627 RepID=A0A0F7ZK57_9HYPO|nr:hypothetical protein HIM_05477 [Hirsutella minnesotensis 3608]